MEEVVREEEVQGEDTGSEQQFGVFKDFDFLDVSCHSRERRSGAGGEEESKEEIEQRTGRCWVGLHSSASWRRLSAHTPAERKSEDERGALQHKVSERTGQRMWRRKARRGITASG